MERAPDEQHERQWPTPRIYVGDLSRYNDGQFRGVWVDADRDAGELRDDIASALPPPPESGAELYAIAAYDNFQGLHIREFEALETVAALARGIRAHGPAFAAFADWFGTAEASAEAFEGHWEGRWDSVEHYAESQLDDMGAERAIPEWIRRYVRVDVAGFARDLLLGGTVHAAENPAGGVDVFLAV